MRNYKLNTKEKWEVLCKNRTFAEEQIKLLEERGYKFEDLFQMFTKHVAPFIDLKLDMSKGDLVFYCDRFFYPSELSRYIKDDESLIKIYTEVKWLKQNGFFIQKK